MGVRHHRAGAELGSVGQRHAHGTIALDQDAADAGTGTDLGPMLGGVIGDRL